MAVGDWTCPACSNVVYGGKDQCNRCKFDRVAAAKYADKAVDWLCADEKCNARNFARRENCFKCSKPRPAEIRSRSASGALGAGESPRQSPRRSPKGHPLVGINGIKPLLTQKKSQKTSSAATQVKTAPSTTTQRTRTAITKTNGNGAGLLLLPRSVYPLPHLRKKEHNTSSGGEGVAQMLVDKQAAGETGLELAAVIDIDGDQNVGRGVGVGDGARDQGEQESAAGDKQKQHLELGGESHSEDAMATSVLQEGDMVVDELPHDGTDVINGDLLSSSVGMGEDRDMVDVVVEDDMFAEDENVNLHQTPLHDRGEIDLLGKDEDQDASTQHMIRNPFLTYLKSEDALDAVLDTVDDTLNLFEEGDEEGGLEIETPNAGGSKKLQEQELLQVPTQRTSKQDKDQDAGETQINKNRRGHYGYGDWDCENCNYTVFGSKSKCEKCGRRKPLAATFSNAAQRSRDQRREGDFDCYMCGELVFGRHGTSTTCFKCKFDRLDMEAEIQRYKQEKLKRHKQELQEQARNYGQIESHLMVRGGGAGEGAGGTGRSWQNNANNISAPKDPIIPTQRLRSDELCVDDYRDENGMLVATPFRPGDWTCPACGINVFMSKNSCFKCGYDRLKPLTQQKLTTTAMCRESKLAKVFAADWPCPGCGVMVFGSKDACFKCGYDRTKPQELHRKPDDWVCAACGKLIFGSKNTDQCFKCGARRGAAVLPLPASGAGAAPPNATSAATSTTAEAPVVSQRTAMGGPGKGGKADAAAAWAGTRAGKSTRGGQKHREPDWPCPSCGATVFGSKNSCFKCGYDRTASGKNGGGGSSGGMMKTQQQEINTRNTGSTSSRNGLETQLQAPHDSQRALVTGSAAPWAGRGGGMNASASGRTENQNLRARSRSPRRGRGGGGLGGAPAKGGVAGGKGGSKSNEVRPGDWGCPKCGMNVFASKMSCFGCGYKRKTATATS